MSKLNCWEFMKCGKEPGGSRTEESGVCPIASEASADSLNDGINGGRLCWVIADICNYKIKCSATHHNSSCFSCEFRYKVMADEGLLKVCETTGLFLQLKNPPKGESKQKSIVTSKAKRTQLFLKLHFKSVP